MSPAAPAGALALEELRRAYRVCADSGGGHCKDHAHVEALVSALEREVARLSARMNRTGTVYHVPRGAASSK